MKATDGYFLSPRRSHGTRFSPDGTRRHIFWDPFAALISRRSSERYFDAHGSWFYEGLPGERDDKVVGNHLHQLYKLRQASVA